MASVNGASAIASEPRNISPSPIADGERAALARHDHEIVVAGEDQRQRERAFAAAASALHVASHRIVAGLELAR